MAPTKRSWEERPHTGGLLIAVFLACLAGLTLMIPAPTVWAHNILHHLNFLPLMIAGMLFGWRGAALASLSWQMLLAAVGAAGTRFFSPRFRLITNVVGNIVVIGLGVRTLMMALSS